MTGDERCPECGGSTPACGHGPRAASGRGTREDGGAHPWRQDTGPSPNPVDGAEAHDREQHRAAPAPERYRAAHAGGEGGVAHGQEDDGAARAPQEAERPQDAVPPQSPVPPPSPHVSQSPGAPQDPKTPQAPEGGGTGRPPEEGGAAHPADDPLHIRPYVRLHEAGTAAAADTPPEPDPAAEPPRVTLPGVGDGQSPPLPDLSPFAAHGTEETAELPAVVGDGGRARGDRRTRAGRRTGDGTGETAPPSGSGAPAVHRRPQERRRPSTAVFAGVGVAAVLGAGLLTTQILTDRGGHSEDGRALRTLPTDAPTHALPTASPSQGPTAPPSGPSASAPSRPDAGGTARADRDSDAHVAPPSPSRSPEASPSRRDKGEDRDDERGDRGRPDRTSGGTLRPGDSGAQVAELQRRLKEAGFYDRDAEEDGVYSTRVQEGVFRYQARYHIQDDTPGDYGPATRRHLEARTSG
ncbi:MULTISPECIES: peptidoglycan-binding protein [Streptomyces]|uniref:peptidoglycan-binding protein n=1 Tax=Streptomyces TaxID=1883 RepID=UPI000B16E173|nr:MULTISPECIES: peptidoglycan-binding protein [Streptomyces]